MRKTVLILDLDNTIYPVHSIGNEVFASLFRMIETDGNHNNQMEQIKDDIMRRPFQVVARDFGFSEALTRQGLAHLQDLTYRGRIEPFEDFAYVRNLPLKKFLVTTGFLKLQRSKIEGLKLDDDFTEIQVVDPATSDRTKKDVFADILKRHNVSKDDVLVVGDDLRSEIKAAQDLGVAAVLYDHYDRHQSAVPVPKITDFHELKPFLQLP